MDSAPPCTVKLFSVRPVTTSEKLNVNTGVAAALMTLAVDGVIVAVGAVASIVNANAVDAGPTLPDASVWRTVIDFAPSPVSVNVVPVPAL